jgi:hypothetical protein
MRRYLPLLRLRLLPSAITDVLAGSALAGGLLQAEPLRLLALIAASALLYASGMVWNDIADVSRDRALGRQDKPLVSGSVPRSSAIALALAMNVAALATLLAVGMHWHGLALLGSILLYDFVGTRHAAAGVVLLPLCRLQNLQLGFFAHAIPISAVSTLALTPALALAGLAYGAYVGLAILHGRLEDQESASPSRSLALILAALGLPLVGILLLPQALWGLAATIPIYWGAASFFRAERSRARVIIPARTGLLLRGLSRFGVVLALGAGDLVAGAIAAALAYGVPALLGLSARRWT